MIPLSSVSIFDDDEEHVVLLIRALAKINYHFHCVQAGNTRFAFDQLKFNLPSKPDYIFLDITLAAPQGAELLKKIKRDSSLAPVPVFVYTHSTLEADRTEAMALGAADYVIKPADPKRVAPMITSLLRDHVRRSREAGMH